MEECSACLKNALLESLSFFYVKNFTGVLLKQGFCVHSVCANTLKEFKGVHVSFHYNTICLANEAK